MDDQEGRPVTTVTCTYYGCDVDGARLRQFIRLAEGAETGAPVVLETSRNDTTLAGGSLDLLLAAVGESTEPGDPDDIDNVAMRSTGAVRSLVLTIDGTAVMSTARGDTRWARGVTEEVRGLLVKGCGGRPQQSAGGLLHAAIATPFAAAIGLGLLGARVLPWTPWGYLTAAILTVLGGLIGFVVGRVRRRRDRCRLSVGELPTRRWWSGVERRDRIAVVAAGIAFLALVANSVNVLVR